jgi:CHAD domain-containing protein
MSYQIEQNEPFPDAIRRIILAELALARTYLTERPSDLSADEAIHEARKCFKKLRAALRLVRNDIGETSFNRENAAIRDAGRLLSDLRDSYVLVETVDSLQDKYEKLLQPDALANVRRQLLARYERTSTAILGDKALVAQVVAILDESRSRLAALPISSAGSAAWRGGLRRVYRRGRRRMALAYEQSTAEKFHDWRKRVKYFWYHLLILQPLWQTADSTWADDVHTLSDYLGLEHDLAVLGDVVLHEDIRLKTAERDLLLALIAHERSRLQAQAQPLGERLYADTPAELVEQMIDYWQEWAERE